MNPLYLFLYAITLAEIKAMGYAHHVRIVHTVSKVKDTPSVQCSYGKHIMRIRAIGWKISVQAPHSWHHNHFMFPATTCPLNASFPVHHVSAQCNIFRCTTCPHCAPFPVYYVSANVRLFFGVPCATLCCALDGGASKRQS